MVPLHWCLQYDLAARTWDDSTFGSPHVFDVVNVRTELSLARLLIGPAP